MDKNQREQFWVLRLRRFNACLYTRFLALSSLLKAHHAFKDKEKVLVSELHTSIDGHFCFSLIILHYCSYNRYCLKYCFVFFYQIRVTIFAVFITELFTLSKISGITQYDDRIKTFLAKKVCERRVLSCWDFT